MGEAIDSFSMSEVAERVDLHREEGDSCGINTMAPINASATCSINCISIIIQYNYNIQKVATL